MNWLRGAIRYYLLLACHDNNTIEIREHPWSRPGFSHVTLTRLKLCGRHEIYVIFITCFIIRLRLFLQEWVFQKFRDWFSELTQLRIQSYQNCNCMHWPQWFSPRESSLVIICHVTVNINKLYRAFVFACAPSSLKPPFSRVLFLALPSSSLTSLTCARLASLRFPIAIVCVSIGCDSSLTSLFSSLIPSRPSGFGIVALFSSKPSVYDDVVLEF